MAITDGLKSVIGNQINLPVIGAISVPVAIGGAVLLYFLLKRKRVTSITTRYGR